MSTLEQRVKQVNENQVKRHPRKIEQRDGPLTAKEASHRIDIAAAFKCFGGRKPKRGMSIAT